MSTTNLEKESLEAHVDLCAIRYQQLEGRLDKVETKIDTLHSSITTGQQSMTKVVITATGTIIAGMLSTVVVVLMKF